PPHSHAGTSGISSKAEFSNVTISLRSIRDRDHEAGHTDNNAAQPSVSSGKTLSGTITRPMTAMSLMGLGGVKTFERAALVERFPSPASNVRAGKGKTVWKTAAGRTRFPSVNALSEFSHGQGQHLPNRMRRPSASIRKRTYFIRQLTRTP